MLLSYAEAVEKTGSEYELSKALAEGSLIRQESGVYSTRQHVSEVAVVMKKYAKAVLTGETEAR